MIRLNREKEAGNVDPQFVNLHTHSYYCGHGEGEIFEYAEKAVEAGLKVLGFSEHCPVKENRWRKSRMDYSQFPNYIKDVNKAEKDYLKKLKILLGAECDWDVKNQYYSYYKDYLLSELGFDYLIIGSHCINIDGEDLMVFKQSQSKLILHKYTDNLISAMQSGLFLIVAHPDLFANSYRTWDKETISCSRAILECAEETEVVLEINGNGLRKPKIKTPTGLRKPYPLKEFWEMANNYDIKISTSSDAHKPEDVAKLQDGFDFAKKLNLDLSWYCID
ncbi:MAG: histidinol-phosphatase [Sphaerochaetaceae bacterium]|nr:histidinol-phosphatase [Sphaerochaetaceae bacterium]